METEALRSHGAARGAGGLDFLIVGTPRSGTTLVQRIVSELPGVRVPPETHFFSLFARGLLERSSFPLAAEKLREEVERFRSMPASEGLEIEADAILERIGGTCSRVVDLFVAIVQELGGPARMYGEKTPNHLLWWRPLTRALPDLKLVVVIRDPRAVVNSYAAAPFGMDSRVALAERWACDQRQMLMARRELGPERMLELRYEDVVEDPGATSARLREFLGPDGRVPEAGPGAPASEAPLFMPWETWKHAALGPVVNERVAAWRTELSPEQAHVVSRICRREMVEFGYEPETGSGRIRAADQWRRLHFRFRRARLMREIEAASL